MQFLPLFPLCVHFIFPFVRVWKALQSNLALLVREQPWKAA